MRKAFEDNRGFTNPSGENHFEFREIYLFEQELSPSLINGKKWGFIEEQTTVLLPFVKANSVILDFLQQSSNFSDKYLCTDFSANWIFQSERFQTGGYFILWSTLALESPQFMSIPIPSRDGATNKYNLSASDAVAPKIYFVNGIRVQGRDHAKTAALLSLLTERPVWGIYNKTSGAARDLLQCVMDYTQNAGARLSSSKNLDRNPVPDHEVQNTLDDLFQRAFIWNTATATLVRELVENRHKRRMIIAHSQGNLITSNALFVIEDLLGASALANIRVYSLASPSPAWPLGIRRTNGGGGRQENAFMNDLVALLRPHNAAAKIGLKGLQNEGDFRDFKDFKITDPIKPHDTNENIQLNFLKSIRGDIGLSKEFPAGFFDDSAAKIEQLFASMK